MFETLSQGFSAALEKLTKQGVLSEDEISTALREVRSALLEADVSLKVVKDFVEKVKPKVLGQEIVRSTSPGQMIVKIVYDELVSFLGANNIEINLNAVPPVPMMLVGLQGSGKTTTTAKLAKYLEVNKGDNIFTPPLEIHATFFPVSTSLIVSSLNPRDQETYEKDTVRVDFINKDNIGEILKKFTS